MDKSEQFWDTASKNYDSTEERFEPIHSWSREKAKQYIGANDTVLDFGCGTGTVTCEFAKLVRKIVAIDVSNEMVELAKAKCAADDTQNAEFRKTTIFELEMNNESLDVVLAFNMLHTIPNPQESVRRIRHLLKPGGTFISVTPCMAEKKSVSVSVQILLFRTLSAMGLVPIRFERYTSVDIDNLITENSFQLIESETMFAGATSCFVVAKKPFT